MGPKIFRKPIEIRSNLIRELLLDYSIDTGLPRGVLVWFVGGPGAFREDGPEIFPKPTEVKSDLIRELYFIAELMLVGS